MEIAHPNPPLHPTNMVSIPVSVKPPGMKAYASTLSNIGFAAFASTKMQSIVKKVARQEEQIKNVIIYSLSESENKNVHNKVEEVLAELGEKPIDRDCSRLGLQK